MLQRPVRRATKLPPLILHPFADQQGPAKLVESSRASLMLQGFLPRDEYGAEELERLLLEGRLSEIRMLYYVGKDLLRWMQQCLEHVGRDGMDLEGLTLQSFASLLIEDTPPLVREKLARWGVVDFKSIFSRAIALNVMFAECPRRELLGDEFVRNYYRYADTVYVCHRGMHPFRVASSELFDFDLFASGEYSRMLEREWEGA